FRHIQRNWVFTFINIIGLAIGMIACLLITQYVMHELSYDDFHERKNSIYRIQQDRYDKGELSTRWAAGCAGIGVDMKAEFPEVKHYVRMYSDEGILANNEVVFKEENLSFASEDFFSVFSFPLKEGVDSLVLRDPF